MDLFYHNIRSQIILTYPISIVFSIKQNGDNIQDLTKHDIKYWRSYFDLEAQDSDSLNYFYEELQLYKSIYKGYSGNSYTYYTFKQLVKLFLKEIYIYEYKGQLLIYKELVGSYYRSFYKHPSPSSIKPLRELIENGEIKKIKYQCTKVLDPLNIHYQTICDLKIFLIDISKNTNFMDSYDTLFEKDFSSFWNYDAELENSNFMKDLHTTKNKQNLTKKNIFIRDDIDL